MDDVDRGEEVVTTAELRGGESPYLVDSEVSWNTNAEQIEFIERLIACGGPEPTEYASFANWTNVVADNVSNCSISAEHWLSFWHDVSTRALAGTMQADSYLQPHGYHGDFEIIDAIYTQRMSQNPCLEKWDRYFHAQAAPQAVRNRKAYFHELLRRSEQDFDATFPDSFGSTSNIKLRVLNVASGPGRDMREWFESMPATRVRFNCVELDPKAIHYASKLCAPWIDSVMFYQANALRFRTVDRFHLIWSAGLFDYLNDTMFVRLLKSFVSHCLPGGEIVIGNFGPYNPSRNYMELLGGWKLIHRGGEHLKALAQRSGVSPENVSIGQEQEGVNLFLHIRSP